MPGVKAGDLAIVKSAKPHYNGRIVEILHVAPGGGFRLPNHQWHSPITSPGLHWVIKAIGAPMLAPVSGEMRPVWYGSGADANLFPLPGDEEPEKESEPVTVTTEPR